MVARFRSGFVTLIGRPNVGKSTLLNRLVGQKVSITSHRPQTTRHRILGIRTQELAQVVYVDTPGLHAPGSKNKMLHRYLNRTASGALLGVDCVMLLIAASGWGEEDERVLALVGKQPLPVILVINKIDRVKRRQQLLPLIEQSSTKMDFAEIVPVSAKTGLNLQQLEAAILRYLPEQPALFPADQLTDRSDRFLAAELLREQVFHSFGEEVPYAVAVEIEGFKQEAGCLHVDALIWVERKGQKAILIGKKGERLKVIGRAARLEMENLLQTKVNLKLWVKVREGWSDNERALRSLGYGEGE